MLTRMGHPLLSNSHSIISNPKSLFNINNYQWLQVNRIRTTPEKKGIKVTRSIHNP
jgi:hypothetical protein